MIIAYSIFPALLAGVALLIANFLGVVSIAMSFTRFRHRDIVLAPALLSGVTGIIMSLFAGWPNENWDLFCLASWSPVVLGGVSVLRWNWRRE